MLNREKGSFDRTCEAANTRGSWKGMLERSTLREVSECSVLTPGGRQMLVVYREKLPRCRVQATCHPLDHLCWSGKVSRCSSSEWRFHVSHPAGKCRHSEIDSHANCEHEKGSLQVSSIDVSLQSHLESKPCVDSISRSIPDRIGVVSTDHESRFLFVLLPCSP